MCYVGHYYFSRSTKPHQYMLDQRILPVKQLSAWLVASMFISSHLVIARARVLFGPVWAFRNAHEQRVAVFRPT